MWPGLLADVQDIPIPTDEGGGIAATLALFFVMVGLAVLGYIVTRRIASKQDKRFS